MIVKLTQQDNHVAISEQLHINCPPTMAFDLMADVRNVTRWNDGASRADLVTEEPIGIGTRFVTVNRGQELESRITRLDRPDRLEFDVTGKLMDVAGAFTFTPSGEGTTLVMEFEPSPKGIMKALFPLLRPVIRRDLRTQHLKFKDFCEMQRQQPTAG